MSKNSQANIKFPKSFFWGASTSAHQVEGNTHNQWTVWELENAKSLASAAQHKLDYLDNWEDIKSQATKPENYVSGNAADHYNLYKQDFKTMQAMGLNSFRFSIEWSRIEPKEGQFDANEIQHYREYLKQLKMHGLEPFVTLYHWTVPVWFDKKGGFEKQSNIKYFVRFAEKIIDELGPDLSYITTINEPDTVMSHGYIIAEHPPQKHSWMLAVWVYINLLRAHRRIFKLAISRSRRFKVGFSKSYACVEPVDSSWKSRLAVRLDYLVRDDLPLWFIGKRKHFLGVNFYFSDLWQGTNRQDHHGDTPRSDLGWEMIPANLEKVLLRLAKRQKDVDLVVSETGVADANDKWRKWWLVESTKAIAAARHQGAKVVGYLHWSLLDNFEWAFGKWPRFGLLEVDYKTMKRTPRASAKWYASFVKQMRAGK